VLPVSYARAAEALRAAITEREPDVVVAFGLAETRTTISIERYAHNLDEAATTDNDASNGTGTEIEPGGPLALKSALPVDALVAELEGQGIPAEISRDAGGFLCNHVMYVLLREHGNGGFVHVPPLEVLPLEELLRAARIIVSACEPHRSPS
jgi:pyroglutamyl-peptidase